MHIEFYSPISSLIFILFFLFIFYSIIKRAVRVGINHSLLITDEQREADRKAKERMRAYWLGKEIEEDKMRATLLRDVLEEEEE